ncbi:MAG: lytic transglycosylase domain-containing protein [Chlorobi bacterium]|nr:lytic transglycosylase domain-containing protein [Chlorobiota bacterium]
MNKILSYLLLAFVIAALVIGIDFWKEKRDGNLPGKNEQYYKIVALPTPDTLDFAGEEVPLNLFYAKESLDKELSINTYWHSSTLQLMKKTHRWFPLIEDILKKNNIPDDFKYLAVIESGLSNVTSPAGAKGYWQLMKGTAKDYDLQVDKYVDERYNVKKSTEVACKYLQKSYDKFGSWTMAAASYNAGITGMLKQIDRQNEKSYYDLLLNDETARYIYRILATKLIYENPENYGFYLDEQDYYEPIPTKIVEVKTSIEDWADFASQQGISYKLLKYFNPWLRQKDIKNRKKKTYYIEIPEEPYNMTHIARKTNKQ